MVRKKPNFTTTPDAFFRKEADGIIYVYAVQYGCCHQEVKLDGLNSDFTTRSDVSWYITTSSPEFTEITQNEFLKIQDECYEYMLKRNKDS